MKQWQYNLACISLVQQCFVWGVGRVGHDLLGWVGVESLPYCLSVEAEVYLQLWGIKKYWVLWRKEAGLSKMSLPGADKEPEGPRDLQATFSCCPRVAPFGASISMDKNQRQCPVRKKSSNSCNTDDEIIWKVTNQEKTGVVGSL
jgi:hypothetical protein